MTNKNLVNFHTHTHLCKHAEGKPIDYVKLAKTLGYKTIGISDHGPINIELVTRRMNFLEYENIYLKEIKDAKKEKGIKVLSALEIEYFEEMLEYYPKFLNELDYLVLGQHYFKYQNAYKSVYDIKTKDEIIAYKNDCITGMKTGYFKIFAHPDVFLWNYPFDDFCKQIAKELIEASIKYNVILELNVNGIRNNLRRNKFTKTKEGKIIYTYPNFYFFELVKQYNVGVVIDEDSHYFSRFHDEATKIAYELANELELEIIDDIGL